MSDEDAKREDQNPVPIETGDVPDIGAADPGPIELDVVMRDFDLHVNDPMTGRDLHLDDIGTEETE